MSRKTLALDDFEYRLVDVKREGVFLFASLAMVSADGGQMRGKFFTAVSRVGLKRKANAFLRSRGVSRSVVLADAA